jgi:RNA polymerase sigma factor FliA
MTIEERNALVMQNIKQAEIIANQLSRKIPKGSVLNYHDLFGAACLGLVDAAGRYDGTRGTKFKTFCNKRIAGEIRDSFRSIDILPRLERQALQKGTMDETTRSLRLLDQQSLYYALPSGDEVSLEFPIPAKQFGDVAQQEVIEYVYKAINRLPPRQRFVLCQYFWGGHRLKAIGEMLGCHESNAFHIYTKAMKRLRLSLQHIGPLRQYYEQLIESVA